MSEHDIEARVYRTRLSAALDAAPEAAPLEAIKARARRETNFKHLLSFGFSNLVRTLLIFVARTYRRMPGATDVESRPHTEIDRESP
jgi:hypothetical protein